MAIQTINIGTVANDGTGDPLRTAFNKANANFSDLDTRVTAHTGDTTNPHGVTAAQVGAPTTADLAAHTGDTTNPHGVTAAQVGLGNVDNTSDADKPVSTAVQTALDTKAPITSPTFLVDVTLPGNPTLPNHAANKAYVDTSVANLVDSAPGTLDTLNELAAALGDDPNFATTVATQIGEKAPLASPALTGIPTAPTADASDDTNQIATTAFVKAQGYASLNSSPTFTGVVVAQGGSVVVNSQTGTECNVWFNDNGTRRGTLYWNRTNQDMRINNHNSSGGFINQFIFGNTGNLTVPGTVIEQSDRRLKTDIETFPDALGTVKKMRGVTFEKDGRRNVGVIAQEMMEALPEVVHGDESKEMLSVAYSNIIGVLIEAIKELEERVEALENAATI